MNIFLALITFQLFLSYYAYHSVQLIGTYLKSDVDLLIKGIENSVNSNNLEEKYYSILGVASQKKLEKVDCKTLALPNSIEESYYYLSLFKLLECSETEYKYAIKDCVNPKDLFFYIISKKKIGKEVEKDEAILKIKGFLEGENNSSWLTYIFACVNELSLSKTQLTEYKSVQEKLVAKFVSADVFTFLESGVFNTVLSFEYLDSFCVSTKICIDETTKVKILNYIYHKRKAYGDVKSVVKGLQVWKKFAKSSSKYLVMHASLSTGQAVGIPLKLAKNSPGLKVYVSPMFQGVGLPQKVSIPEIKVKKRGSKEVITINVKSTECKPQSDSLECLVTFNSKLSEIGSYSLNIVGADAGKNHVFGSESKETVVIPAAVNGQIDFSKVSIKEYDNSNLQNEMSLAYPTKDLFPLQMKEGSKKTFTLDFKAGSDKPTQVTAILASIEKSIDMITSLICSETQNNEFTCSITKNTLNNELGDFEGKLKLSFIVGGPGIEKNIKWDFGLLALTSGYTGIKPSWNESWNDVSRKTAKSAAGSKTYVINEAKTHSKKQELFHTFKQPEKRAPPFLSNVFTILILANFCMLLVGWVVVGFNLSNFPCSLYPLIFHGGLVAIFSTYFFYWIKFNMFTTIKYSFLIGLITFYSGYRTLRSLSDKNSE